MTEINKKATGKKARRLVRFKNNYSVVGSDHSCAQTCFGTDQGGILQSTLLPLSLLSIADAT